MGHEDLSDMFDPVVKENRAFTDLLTFDSLSALMNNTYHNAITIVNTQANTTFIITNVIIYKYRVFPIGNYVKIMLKTEELVGYAHLVFETTKPEFGKLLNLHTTLI